MKIIKLQQPFPRQKPSVMRRYEFFYGGFLPLPKTEKFRWPSLGNVLESRRSRRTFQRPLSFQQLAALVWHSNRLREKKLLENGSVWESRVAPSGGGCHPIHVVVLSAPDFSRDILVYDAHYEGFGVVGNVDHKLIRKALREVEECIRIEKGTVLWFLADISKTAGKYLHPESLIWRDSGALLATVSLVAEAMGLEACGLGIHETPSLRKIFRLPESAFGVGGCIVSA